MLYSPIFRKRHTRNDESQDEGGEESELPKKKKSRRTREADSDEHENGDSKKADD